MGSSHPHFSKLPSLKMRHLILISILCVLGVAQDPPRYSCPEVDVNFHGNTIDTVHDVLSWEDCGTICSLTSSCLFWSWDYSHEKYLNDCYLKDSDDGFDKY